jgi:hypothetical protein
MRDVTTAFFGAFVGSAFSLIAMLVYIAAVRRVGRRVFKSWLLALWFPVHLLFAITLMAPMFFPFYALGIAGASFPLPNALKAVAIVFGSVGLVPPLIYFFRQWYNLQRAGYLPPPKGLTNR